MFALCYTISAFRLRKIEHTNIKTTLAKRCSNVIVLLCIAETERIQSLMRTLARMILSLFKV